MELRSKGFRAPGLRSPEPKKKIWNSGYFEIMIYILFLFGLLVVAALVTGSWFHSCATQTHQEFQVFSGVNECVQKERVFLRSQGIPYGKQDTNKIRRFCASLIKSEEQKK